MGFQDCLHMMRVPYASMEAVQFADTSMEAVCYYAYLASTELAEERGRYESYPGSLWDRASCRRTRCACWPKRRGGYLEVDASSGAGLDAGAQSLKHSACANSNAWRSPRPPPCSNIIGVSAWIEPDLPEPVREVEPVGRVYRDQCLPGRDLRRATCGTRS